MEVKIARPRPCVKCGSPSYAYELEKIDQGYRAYWACSKEFCFGRFYTTELSTSLMPITKEELAKLQPNPAKGIAAIEEN
ncbi:MAG: hypothetical protein HMLIMOIP_000360 [Candidatus Nitrosomirales archaeon]|jgi:hypothetical protein